MEDCIAKQQGIAPVKIKTGDENFLVGTWKIMKRVEEKFFSKNRIFR
jgi:hypothetical protein